MNFTVKQIEKKVGVDLNGDGLIGSGRRPGEGGLVNHLERATHIDLNGDGRIGGHPNYPPNFNHYGGPSYPPPFAPYGNPNSQSNFPQSGAGGGLINQLEKATNMDLNGDGRIGGQPNYPPNFNHYDGLSYPPPFAPYGNPNNQSNFPQSGAGGGLMNELEKATHMDLNGDGRIGGQPNYSSSFNPYGGPSYPRPSGPYGNPNNQSNFPQPGTGGSLVNELEKATNIDLNRDGRIGGQPNNPPNFNAYGGSSYPSNFGSYGNANNQSNFPQPGAGGGLINELEKATNIDLNGDGRIGGQPNYPPNLNPYGGPSYPPSFGPYGNANNQSNIPQSGAGGGLINELEKATNIDLNGDGRIGGQPNHLPNFNPYGYGH